MIGPTVHVLVSNEHGHVGIDLPAKYVLEDLGYLVAMFRGPYSVRIFTTIGPEYDWTYHNDGSNKCT